MNAFRRIRDIVSSNINAVLDKMENPEKMIDLSVSEMEDTIHDIRLTIAEKTGEMNALEAAIRDKKDAVSRWEERARIAASKEMDDMAKEAISEKIRISEEIRKNEESLSSMKNLISALEASRDEGIEKLNEMRSQASEIKIKARSSKERKKAAEAIERSRGTGYEKRIEEIKARISRWEAEADACITAKNEESSGKLTFEELERQEAAEKELAELKKSMQSR